MAIEKKIDKKIPYSPKNPRNRAKKVSKGYLTAELQQLITEYNEGSDKVKPQDKISAIKLLIDLHGMKDDKGQDFKDLKVTLKI